MPTRDESPLEYVGVSEAACQRRTQAITQKIEGVGKQVSGLDKKLDVHLAGLKGADRAGQTFQSTLKVWLAVLSALVLLGGIVWGAARLAQPDVAALAKAINDSP